MHIKTIEIRDFRNIAQLTLELSPKVTLIWGDNAQGKTNILEAVYLCATGRSFRTRNERSCLPWDSPPDTYAVLKALAKTESTEHTILVSLSENRKYIEMDGKQVYRLGEMFGAINVVLFTPDDLSLLKGPPSIRRRFMDMEISQVDREYLYSLQRYTQALRQRNALLRSGKRGSGLDTELRVWDEVMVEHGALIYMRRATFVKEISHLASDVYRTITSRDEMLALKYGNFLGSGAMLSYEEAQRSYADLFVENRRSDIERQQTNIGPHRDEIHVFIQTFDARMYASQGQQRTAALALKLAEIELLKRRTGKAPVLLLDDVTSELDPHRRDALLHYVRFDTQTVVTATEKHIVADQMGVDTFFHIRNGTYTED